MRHNPEGMLNRVVMVARRDRTTDRVTFLATGFLLTGSLAISVGHAFEEGDRFTHEVRPAVPGGHGGRERGPNTVELVVRHRDPSLDLALLVLRDDWADVAPIRLGVLPGRLGSVPFRSVGFPDFALDRQVPTTRQITGEVLLGSFLGRAEMELSLSSPPPGPPTGGHLTGSPWTGFSGAGVLVRDDVLVGVCSSHHVLGGTASLTATGFEGLSRDPKFVRYLVAHHVDPDPVPVSPTADTDERLRDIHTHHEVLSGLHGRRTHLTGSQLSYVSPGPSHEADPRNLLRRLSTTDPRGVLLVGPAGAGKTRTCFEVAAAADRAGWRVLHVRANSSVTVEALSRAVLGGERGRVLLVLDYLDTCPQLDLRLLVDAFLPEAKRLGVHVAVLSSVRPGALLRLRRRGAGLLFDEVLLRQDEEHRTAVIAHILHEVAPKSLQQWGEAALARVCGRRPVIALLIADALERRLRAGRPVQDLTLIRPGELISWIRDGIWQDVLTSDSAGAAGGRPAAGIPDLAHLAFAAAVSVCPQPRRAVEDTVDALLSTRSRADRGVMDGRRAIDTLISLGWMDESEGELQVVHDIVTDELAVHCILPPPGWTVHGASAEALFDTAARLPRSFVLFAGHLRRLVSDLEVQGPNTRSESLERFCREWVARNAAGLGALLENAGKDGEQALLTMVLNAPWKSGALDAWDALVRPWLLRAERKHAARPFLDAALSDPQNVPQPLVRAALSWLSRRSGQTDADYVIKALLERSDLSPSQEHTTVRCALSWVPEHGGWRAAPLILGQLLKRDHDPDRLDQVMRCVFDWLGPRRNPEASAAVLRHALRYQGLTPDHRREAVRRARTWFRDHHDAGATPRAASLLRALLSCPGLTESERRSVLELALGWLASNHTGVPSAGAVLRVVLDLHQLTPEQAGEVTRYVDEWSTRHPSNVHRSNVLRALLANASTGGSAGPLSRLAGDPTNPAAAAALERLLEQNLAPEEADALFSRAFRWLELNPAAPDRRLVLQAMLWRQDLVGDRLVELADLAVAELRSDPVPALLGTFLARRTGLRPDQARFGIELALDRCSAPAAAQIHRPVLCPLLRRPDLTADQASRAVALGLERLSTNLGKRTREVLCALLERRDLSRAQLSQLMGHAARWLTERGSASRTVYVVLHLLERDDLPPEIEKDALRRAREALQGSSDSVLAHRLRAQLTRRTASPA